MDRLPLILTSARLKNRNIYKCRQNLRSDGRSAYQLSVNKLLDAKKLLPQPQFVQLPLLPKVPPLTQMSNSSDVIHIDDHQQQDILKLPPIHLQNKQR